MLVMLKDAGYIRTEDIQRFVPATGLANKATCTFRTGELATFSLADSQLIRRALDAEIQQQAGLAMCTVTDEQCDGLTSAVAEAMTTPQERQAVRKWLVGVVVAENTRSAS